MNDRSRGRLGLAVAFAAGLAVAGAATAGAAGLLTGKNIKDGSIQARDLSPSLRARLAPARTGGLAGAPGKQGPPGPQGPPGQQGPAGWFTTTLPAGQTVRGVINEDSVAAIPDEIRGGGISFGVSLNSAPTVVIRPPNAPPTAQCPGSVGDPRAASGALCIYLIALSNIREVPPTGRQLFVFTIPDQDDGANTFGAEYFIHSNTAGRFFLDATWAVTGN